MRHNCSQQRPRIPNGVSGGKLAAQTTTVRMVLVASFIEIERLEIQRFTLVFTNVNLASERILYLGFTWVQVTNESLQLDM
jgi:hypothetical protein